MLHLALPAFHDFENGENVGLITHASTVSAYASAPMTGVFVFVSL